MHVVNMKPLHVRKYLITYAFLREMHFVENRVGKTLLAGVSKTNINSDI